ncbi:hypothetical protein JTE90_020732 [Oedothorax gibbosus]|uniref:Msx2-interacting protein n=1 Tax=Oedothorax gibbosus TaxID=931172 RepID=A0AAV6V6A7_9ARAC|nr:hypothetical protein JTE90_020732 [Oedothorax gibbosus]
MVRETRYLWIGNLPHTIREERILEHFKRYGKVQSVKILPKKQQEEDNSACATVAFIDIKSASKAHNADNKIDDRTLKTDYYEPPASSTASSAIYIHERDDTLVRPAPAPYAAGRTPRYGINEERNYDRPGHYYADREPYMRRPLGIGYHDEDNYQGRAKSRDRYSRSTPGNNYVEGAERNQNHFRPHNARPHFDQQRYPADNQYPNDREPAAIPNSRINNRRPNNSTPQTPTSAVVPSVSSPTVKPESRPRRTKRRSPSRTPSGSRSNSRSRSRSSSGSRSSSSSSKLRSSSSDSSGGSRSPSKSRSPVASYGSQQTTNSKGSRSERPSSAISTPSSFLPSAVSAPPIPNVTPSQNCSTLTIEENHCSERGDEKRPLGICVRNLPVRSTDTSLKDGLFHEYKKHGKVTMVKVIGQGTDRYAVVCFKKTEDVDKALEVSKDKLFFGCKIEVTAHEGLDAEDNEFRPLEAELDEFHPKATRTLFIGNLEKDITTQELRDHFEQFGEIIEIDIKKQGTGASYAFIQYSDIGSVVKAMRKLDGENLGANRIKLGFGKSMPTNCVWLDGIVDSVSDKFLARHFSRFGIVAYTAVDREKGHALVFYENVEFAQIAVSEMRGRILQGKKLQVDFASRECQTTFFDKLEMTGQLVPGDGTRPWERRERRGPEFEVIRNDDRDTRVGFENRTYPRYEGQPRPPRGSFRGGNAGQRVGFSSRGRGQSFPGRYEVPHEDERRHRYNTREENNLMEVTMFDSKAERPKYVEGPLPPDCPNRNKRRDNKLRNSISDQESHHSQSPPRSRHQSRSTSPASSKDRKATTPKDRSQHHRTKSPGGSHNSSLINSPAISDDLEGNSDYRDSRRNSGVKPEDLASELSYVSPRSVCSEKEDRSLTKAETDSLRSLSKVETDSVRSRSSLDVESADETDHLAQMERKKRLLASSNLKGGKELNLLVTKTLVDRMKAKVLPNNHKSPKLNCVSGSPAEEGKCDIDVQLEKPQQMESANTDLKYLQKRQVQLLHLLEHLGDSLNEGLIDGERLGLKKGRSPSDAASLLYDSETLKALIKEEFGIKLCNSSIKDPSILAKLKSKIESMEGSDCISLSLDSFIFQKHLDPRRGSDQHSVSSGNTLPNCRRISVDNETGLPSTQGAIDSLFCIPSPTRADVLWKKECNSFSDNFSDIDCSLPSSHVKTEFVTDDDTISKKSLNSSFPLDFPSRLLSLRTVSDIRHEIKRERDVSPLSLPLPKFAASLRSPKSSPSVLMSPKSTTAHSPRAGLSPSSYASSKNLRILDLFSDFQVEKKVKESVAEEKVNGVSISPVESMFETETTNEAIELMANFESIQSPKSNSDKIKEHQSSSESESSPSASPNRPSIEDRIKALDEKFNVWSGSTRLPVTPDVLPAPLPETPRAQVKRSRFTFLAPDTRSEPSDIVKSLLAKSTIFDQDSKRLQHIDEKYEPQDVKVETSQALKPTFRTKAAAKEFSIPIAPPVQPLNQSSFVKTDPLVAQGVAPCTPSLTPPALTPPQNTSAPVLSPVTPVLQQYNAPVVSPQAFTPCSPCTTPSLPHTNFAVKALDSVVSSIDKDLNDHLMKAPLVFNSVKPKTEPNFHMNSSALATTLKSPLHCSVDIPAHPVVLTSPPGIKKEPSSPTDSVTEIVCKFEIDCKVPMKKETLSNNVTNIPVIKDIPVTLSKDHVQFNSIDHNKKEFCDSKDPRLAFHEGSSHWRDNGCKDGIKVNMDSCAKPFVNNPGLDSVSAACPATKKRVSSIDSTESESSKSVKSLDSSRDSQEISWVKQEKTSEPEPKKPKLSKSFAFEGSVSPPTQQHSRKNDKKEKPVKTEKPKISTTKTSSNIPEKVKLDIKTVTKLESRDKDRLKSEQKNKEEKTTKSRDSKETVSSKEHRIKSRERKNSEKDIKSNTSNNPSNKVKKDQQVGKSDSKHDNKRESDKKHESKKEGKQENKSESKHESRTDKHESKNDIKHESKSDKHESKASSKHENKQESKMESKNDKHESKIDSKQESKSDNKHESKNDNKHSSKSDSRHESRSECRHESKNESRHESKTDSKHEGKSENRHEGKSENRHEGKSEIRHEGKGHEGKSESRHEGKSESRHEGKSESRHEGKSEDRHEGKNENRHENKAEVKSDNKHDNKLKSKNEDKYECKNESESEGKSEDAKSDKKQGEKKSKKSSVSSLPFDWAKWMDDEPVYFSMYDKVKARSSKSQVLKHQTNDLESVRQKFSKLKQRRAKREDKSKSIDSDKDSDTGSHHSSESDSQTKSSKSKQPRKRKLVIDSSSDDDRAPHDSSSRISKIDKDFSDSATDSDFEYNVSRKQASNMKVRKKKTEVLDSDSSDSDSNFHHSKSQSSTSKNASHNRIKSRTEKLKKVVKSDYEISDAEMHHKSKEKENKLKKLKKEKTVDVKTEYESMDYELQKKHDETKNYKKKMSKDSRSQEPEISSSQKKLKSENSSKEKLVSPKERKSESSNEKMQIDDNEKHKPFSKKRKKSKKMSKSKERRSISEKTYHQVSRKLDDSDAKSSLPVLSPKPSNLMPDKQLSPPCLQAGIFSDNDFSDLDFEAHSNDIDMKIDMWKQDSNSDKPSKTKKKDSSAKSQNIFPEQDSMHSFFDKLSDITDSEPGKEHTDCMSDVPSDCQKLEFPTRKESTNSSPHKNKHEKHHDHGTKQESNKYPDTHCSSSKEERRKKKSKKQSKEKKKKSREEKETSDTKEESRKPSEEHYGKVTPKPESPKSLFDTLAGDDDSMYSNLHIEVVSREESSRNFEDDFMLVTEDMTPFGDDGPSKREEKLLERRFEEEAAKETRRLEAELFSTGRDSWHMDEKDYDDLEPSSDAMCEEKHVNEIDSMIDTQENIFTGLDLHSSGTEPSQNETDVFLSGHSESDSYKLDDKEINEEIEDQRKIEDDLAVTALLQEMNSGEISAPELTKETDYLDPLIETHPEETMNYLIPDDGENSLHIASSPEVQGNESQDEKLEASDMLLSPASNSEPPALEISNVEDSVLIRIEETIPGSNENLKVEVVTSTEIIKEIKPISCYDFHDEDSMELAESKPPVIDIPVIETVEQPMLSTSPKGDRFKLGKAKEKSPTKLEINEDTDNELDSEITKGQLTHFEDITMDTVDSKDDDNPPILIPVEAPHTIVSESKPKEIHQSPIKESHIQTTTSIKTITHPVESTESIFDKLVSDIDKQFGEILNHITDQPKPASKTYMISDSFVHPKPDSKLYMISDSHRYPKTESKPYMISDSHNTSPRLEPKPYMISDSHNTSPRLEPKPYMASDIHNRSPVPIHIPDAIDTNSNDSSILHNSGLFDPPEEIQPLIRPYSEHLEEHNKAENYDKEMRLVKDNILQPLTVTNNLPLTHGNSLHSSSDIPTNQPVPKVDVTTPSVIYSSCSQNHDQYTTASNTKAVTDNNHTNNFLLDLFGPNSVEPETNENYSPHKLKIDESIVSHADSKNKNEDSDISSTDNNHSSQTSTSFEISEVNEQNEATEFNQDIFERASDSVKDPKIPQLLSFSSDQLFNELKNKSAETNDNLSLHTDVSVIKIPKTVSKVEDSVQIENNDTNFHSDYVDTSDRFDVELPGERDLGKSIEDHFSIEDSLAIKTRSMDAESVCSDTTDITIPETKGESEINLLPAQEDEPMLEEVEPIVVDEITKPKVERPRRGRKPKTRKHAETSQERKQQQKQEALPEVVNVIHTRSSSRRSRPTSTETPRRSLRSDNSEPSILREFSRKKRYSMDEASLPEPEKEMSEEPSEGLASDSGIKDIVDKSPTKQEEPKRKRGRKKKVSGNSQTSEKFEAKVEDTTESVKEFHRTKESRLLYSVSANDKDQKIHKDNASSKADVYDFCEEVEDVDYTLMSVKEKLHDTSRNNTSNDLKHEKLESKHDRTTDQKLERASEQKHEKMLDPKQDKTVEHKYEIDQKQETNIEPKHTRTADQKHGRLADHKRSKSSDLEHDRTTEAVSEKDKKIIDSGIVEDHEHSHKEQLTEVKEHNKKISIIIRVSSGISEVVQRSASLNEETKLEHPKSEKTSTKHDTSVSDVPYNGPCKSTRKSTRLLMQKDSTVESMKSVDEVIEDVIKSHGDPPTDDVTERRMTRRSRSNRRSEEGSSREMVSLENSNDNMDDKNANEPVHFIRDNAVKDYPEDKKKISSQLSETSQNSDTSTTESDKTSERGSAGFSLRGYRIRQTQAANKSESCKEVSVVSSLTTSDNESQRKESSLSNSSDEKTNDIPRREHRKLKEVPKEFKITTGDSHINPNTLPVLKLEINRVKLDAHKEILSEKISENEDSNSRASPARVDPVTGILPCSNETKASNSELITNTSFEESGNISKNLVSDQSVYPSVLNIKNISKVSLPASEGVSVISVIQESSKNTQQNVPNEPIPLVPNLRSRQPSAIHPPTISTPQPFIHEKHPSTEKEVEPPKRAIKKNSVPASVLTIANSVIATSTITAVTATEPLGVVTNLAYAHASQGQYPVITDSATPTLSSPTAISPHDRNVNLPPKAQPAHIYEPHVRTSGVATPTSVVHITAAMVPNVQKTSMTSAPSNKAELLPTNIVPTLVSEQHHFTSSSSCKPVLFTTQAPLDHPAIGVKSEVHHPATTSSSGHGVPVATTWSSSKITSSRITESHAHINQNIQQAYPLKVAKVAHNVNSAFSQQPALLYEEMMTTPHLVNSAGGGVISEIVPNLQQRHKEYLASQDRTRGVPSDLAIRGNPTPPDTPTPPSDMHPHGRQTSRMAIINPSINPEYNAYLQHQMMFAHNLPYGAGIHPEIMAASFLGIGSPYVAAPGNFKQPPTNHRQPMDESAKVLNEMSQFQQQEGEKSRSKSSRSKSDYVTQKEMQKLAKMEGRGEDPKGRHLHEKVPSTSAIAPHSMRQQHYPVLQMSERYTDSPGLYIAGQGRGQQIPPIAGQLDDHKPDGGVHHPSHLYKDKPDAIQPPVAHQSTNLYARPNPLASQAHLDGRSSTPAHSPMYAASTKKDHPPPSHHSFPPGEVPPTKPHHPGVRATPLGQPSISPGLQPAHSPMPWGAPVIQPQLAQSPHQMLEGIGRRGAHMGLMPEGPINAPPPAHGMAHVNVPRTPPIANQVPIHSDQLLLQNHPVIWQGLLALKNDQAAVQMHYVSGNAVIAKQSLPPLIHESGETGLLRIAQRMRLEAMQIEGVRKKLQMPEEHCILLALPCGKDPMDVRQQTINLKEGFISYLGKKRAAGIVNAAAPGSQQPMYVIHIFPSCEFTDENLARTAPDMLQACSGINHLVIIIATV